MFSKNFKKLEKVFQDQLHRQKLHSAAQIVVMQDGEVVANHAEGTGRYQGIDESTPFVVFSVSKAFTGLCVHKLIEDGCVELDAPVARYWPEFGQKGKETATIRHAFLHQAGIPAPHLNRQVFTWPWWNLVTRDVASSAAEFAPGSQSSYHLVNYGFILGEVVQRVSGMPVERYLRENFTGPMGLKDIYLRLPAGELKRTPKLETTEPALHTTKNLFNLPFIRTARIPAACLHSSARSLAAVFQMLLDGGVYQGRRYLKPETIRFATSSGYHGMDSYLKVSMNWGHGFILGGGNGSSEFASQSAMGKGSTERTFAGIGLGTCMVWADPDTRVVTAFTCNGMLGDEAASRRWAEVSNAVWEGIGRN